MANETPASRIKMMKASLRCFYFGIASLLPFIGPFLGVRAVFASFRARRYERFTWNPARAQRLIGINCAWTGTLIWIVLDILVVWHIFNAING
jgi:hypothetical protein